MHAFGGAEQDNLPRDEDFFPLEPQPRPDLAELGTQRSPPSPAFPHPASLSAFAVWCCKWLRRWAASLTHPFLSLGKLPSPALKGTLPGPDSSERHRPPGSSGLARRLHPCCRLGPVPGAVQVRQHVTETRKTVGRGIRDCPHSFCWAVKK